MNQVGLSLEELEGAEVSMCSKCGIEESKITRITFSSSQRIVADYCNNCDPEENIFKPFTSDVLYN